MRNAFWELHQPLILLAILGYCSDAVRMLFTYNRMHELVFVNKFSGRYKLKKHPLPSRFFFNL